MSLFMQFEKIVGVYHERYGPDEAYDVLDNDMAYVLNDCMPMKHHVSNFLENNAEVYEYLYVLEETAKEHVDRLWAMLPDAQRELIVKQLI